MPHYPHMAAADKAIWDRYIKQQPNEFDAVLYDVPVGSGADFSTVVNEYTGGDCKRLYQRRIDVIGRQGDVLWIIELKPRASTAALGQVNGYLSLFKRDHPDCPLVYPMLITDILVPEMDYLAQEQNVRIALA